MISRLSRKIFPSFFAGSPEISQIFSWFYPSFPRLPPLYPWFPGFISRFLRFLKNSAGFPKVFLGFTQVFPVFIQVSCLAQILSVLSKFPANPKAFSNFFYWISQVYPDFTQVFPDSLQVYGFFKCFLQVLLEKKVFTPNLVDYSQVFLIVFPVLRISQRFPDFIKVFPVTSLSSWPQNIPQEQNKIKKKC